MKSLLFPLVALAAGCATAARDNPGDDGGVGSGTVDERPDGGPMGTNKDAMVVPVDAAPLPDAPPNMVQVTLSQTNDNTVASNKAIACASRNFFGVVTSTSDNSWYRVFKLADYGITGPFQLQRVTFWTEYAYAGSGTTQAATIKVGTYAGTVEADTLDASMITSLGSMPITVPDADSRDGADPPVETNIAATVPAGSNLIVELALPNGASAGNFFYIGVSAGGEAKKGYIRATPSGCNMTSPKALTTPGGLNRGDNAILMTVTGTK